MEISLNPGDVECDLCKESRAINERERKEKPWISCYSSVWCRKCHGTGKLDWIEQIVGKKHFWEQDFDYSNYSGSFTFTLPQEAIEGQQYTNNSTNISYVYNKGTWYEIQNI